MYYNMESSNNFPNDQLNTYIKKELKMYHIDTDILKRIHLICNIVIIYILTNIIDHLKSHNVSKIDSKLFKKINCNNKVKYLLNNSEAVLYVNFTDTISKQLYKLYQPAVISKRSLQKIDGVINTYLDQFNGILKTYSTKIDKELTLKHVNTIFEHVLPKDIYSLVNELYENENENETNIQSSSSDIFINTENDINSLLTESDIFNTNLYKSKQKTIKPKPIPENNITTTEYKSIRNVKTVKKLTAMVDIISTFTC